VRPVALLLCRSTIFHALVSNAMTEVKKSTRGGARSGAGRKPKAVVPLQIVSKETPLAFLLEVMNDPEADPALRVKAASTAAQYVHTRTKDGGKKEAQADVAKKVAESGRFRPAAVPMKLVAAHK